MKAAETSCQQLQKEQLEAVQSRCSKQPWTLLKSFSCGAEVTDIWLGEGPCRLCSQECLLRLIVEASAEGRSVLRYGKQACCLLFVIQKPAEQNQKPQQASALLNRTLSSGSAANHSRFSRMDSKLSGRFGRIGRRKPDGRF